jgi:4-methylaminobutanoate oxidase (formaldehyde-forming)
MNSLRMEKAYRHWGHDIGDEDSPLEAGLGFAIGWSKREGFVGSAALQQQREAGMRRRLVAFRLLADEPLLYHNEPIWRDGHIAGRITSGMYGHTIGRPLGLGYVCNPDGVASPEWIAAGSYELEIAARRFPAEASLRPFYDPASARIRA